MGRLLLIISKILGSKHLVVNRVLALVDSSRLITSRALAGSKHMQVSQDLDSSRLITSRALADSKHMQVSQDLDSSRLPTSRALAGSKHMQVSQDLGSSRLLTSRILRSKHLVTSTTSAVRTLAGRALVLADSSRLTVNPALVSLVASRIHRVLLSNSSLVVRASLSSLLHKDLVLARCKTSSPGKGKLLTSSGKEVTAPPGRVRNKIKVNHSLVKIKRLFPIIGSLVNSKASETFPVCLP